MEPAAPGFDETLFEALRRMTPEERLALNDRTIETIEELRRGFAAVTHDAARHAARR